MELNRNDLARDKINGAMVLVMKPSRVNGYHYVVYLDSGQRAMVSVSELRPVSYGPNK